MEFHLWRQKNLEQDPAVQALRTIQSQDLTKKDFHKLTPQAVDRLLQLGFEQDLRKMVKNARKLSGRCVKHHQQNTPRIRKGFPGAGRTVAVNRWRGACKLTAWADQQNRK
tara:strand:- start:463 stop:795 length:333 start_codon:yes stop_codon:yes gene_type:complete